MKAPRSWNRIPHIKPDRVLRIDNRHAGLPQAGWPLLAHGNGRSYGDVCLSDRGTLLMTRGLDRYIAFDAVSGVLRCEAGVTLEEILTLALPRGWFLRCTPGTRYVTIGGAVANDVHGKNHHGAGTFGHHVRRFELLRSSGERLECSTEQNADFFHATIGGLGLTGLITWVEMQLMPVGNAWMRTQSQRFMNLDEFWTLNQSLEAEWPYTVAWIDCLAGGRNRGRGLLFAGDHAPPQEAFPVFREKQRRVPVNPPVSLVNKFSLRLFNALYFRQPVNPGGTLTHYLPFFYPLDAIRDWNNIYGRKGFFQYQCVLPPHTARDGVAALLDTISAAHQGSFLAVLKTFGTRPSPGMLSFARPGATLALDFPNQGEPTLQLLSDLDAIVRAGGGTLYPAKDARMPADLFRAGYPQWQNFMRYIDPAFSSGFWRRVTG